MSHLLITYFENLNPSLCNVSFTKIQQLKLYFVQIKYLCDKITQGNFDCGSKSFENIKYRTKLEINSIQGSIINTVNENFSPMKDLEKKSENIKSLSEMLNAANKAKQIVNSLRKSF